MFEKLTIMIECAYDMLSAFCDPLPYAPTSVEQLSKEDDPDVMLRLTWKITLNNDGLAFAKNLMGYMYDLRWNYGINDDEDPTALKPLTDEKWNEAQEDIQRYIDVSFQETEGADRFRIDFGNMIDDTSQSNVWFNKSGDAEGCAPKRDQKAIEEFCYFYGFDFKGVTFL